MKLTQKTKRPRVDYFAFFKKATYEHFRFLIEGYGFKHISTDINKPECAIRYWNETTGVIVFYEWGGFIWVTLVKLRRTATEVIEGEMYSLDLLIRERCPNKAVTQVSRLKEHTDEYIGTVINDYARALEECASDILMGDFQIFPKLTMLAEEEIRRRNKELFGCETGETI